RVAASCWKVCTSRSAACRLSRSVARSARMAALLPAPFVSSSLGVSPASVVVLGSFSPLLTVAATSLGVAPAVASVVLSVFCSDMVCSESLGTTPHRLARSGGLWGLPQVAVLPQQPQRLLLIGGDLVDAVRGQPSPARCGATAGRPRGRGELRPAAPGVDHLGQVRTGLERLPLALRQARDLRHGRVERGAGHI